MSSSEARIKLGYNLDKRNQEQNNPTEDKSNINLKDIKNNTKSSKYQ